MTQIRQSNQTADNDTLQPYNIYFNIALPG